jgi:hypothetical protein
MVEMERMTINERRKYLYRMWKRYCKANRKEKGRLLDEMQAVTRMHRKSLIRILTGWLLRKERSCERGRRYGAAVEDAVRKISLSLDYPCAERLKPPLVKMAVQLREHGELSIEPQTLEQLGRISVSTLKRMLKRIGRQDDKIADRKLPRRQRNHLRKTYPMRMSRGMCRRQITLKWAW